MPDINIAINNLIKIANDNTYGYSQTRRNEQKEDDCSSSLLDSLKLAGFDVGKASYTADMFEPLLSAGFISVSKLVNKVTGTGLQIGDICLRPKTSTQNGHVFMVVEVKNGVPYIVQASSDLDKKRGDSSGKEIKIQPYYNSNATYILRYPQVIVKQEISTPVTTTEYIDAHLFSITLKQDMNVRSEPNSTSKIITVAKKGLGLGIAEISTNGNWGRIQNQISPAQWICITDKYVIRSD